MEANVDSYLKMNFRISSIIRMTKAIRVTRTVSQRRTAVLACLFLVVAARGDQIIVGGKNFTNAEVVNLANGLLQFRGTDGAVRSVHLADIDLLIANRGGFFDDFNEAERFLDAGEPKKAVIRYKRALRLSTGYWSDLIAARLIIAHDRAMEVDKAVQYLIRVTRGKWAGPVAGALLIPSNLPGKRTGSLARAVRELDGALAAHPQQAQAMIFEITRYELLRLMHDDLAPVAALHVAASRIPEEIRTERVYDILVSAMRTAVADEVAPGVAAGVDRAIEECPETHLPDFLLFKGQALLRDAVDRNDLMRASWPFLRVAIHMQGDARAARGLLGAATVLEKLEDIAGMRKLLIECIAAANAEDTVVDEAQRMLDKLDAAEESND